MVGRENAHLVLRKRFFAKGLSLLFSFMSGQYHCGPGKTPAGLPEVVRSHPSALHPSHLSLTAWESCARAGSSRAGFPLGRLRDNKLLPLPAPDRPVGKTAMALLFSSFKWELATVDLEQSLAGCPSLWALGSWSFGELSRSPTPWLIGRRGKSVLN